MENVILVDSQDNPLGLMEKLAAHQQGRLHRAFSVFVFNNDGQLLLQRRAEGKYHSAGLWTNTCCSHPRAGEAIADAAHRRLVEEMGFDCPLTHAWSFEYRAELGDLVEHEYDHVLVGRHDGAPSPDPDEVLEWRYLALDEIQTLVSTHPDDFTAWFKLCLPRLGELADLAAAFPKP